MSATRKLFVGRLPFSKSEQDIWALFSSVGPVIDVVLLRDAVTQQKKGAAFVTFADEEHAYAAVACLDNYSFPGSTRPIGVTFAKSDGGGGGCSGGAAGVPFQPPPPAGMHPAFMGGAPQMQQRPSAGKLRLGGPAFHQPPPPPGMHPGAWSGPPPTPAKRAWGAVRDGPGSYAFQPPPPPGMHPGFGNGPPPTPVKRTGGVMRDGAGGALPQQWNHQVPMSPSVVAPPPAQRIQHAAADGLKLFVGQLPFSRSEEDLKQLFEMYGPVAEVALFRDQLGQKKGAAFVVFHDAESAAQALQLDGYLFEGSSRTISVRLAEPSAKRQRV